MGPGPKMGRSYHLIREQLLGGTLGQVFPFFTDVANLARITPPSMGFRVLDPRPSQLGEGAIVQYWIRIAGVPVKWRTRIAEWDPPHGFVDVQERGPYTLWEHTHSFLETGAGVLMRDHVRYALPFGPLGALVHLVAVRAALGRIFDYRYDVLAARFPVTRAAASSRRDL